MILRGGSTASRQRAARDPRRCTEECADDLESLTVIDSHHCICIIFYHQWQQEYVACYARILNAIPHVYLVR